MPTPEEQAALEQWLAGIQNAGGAQAMFSGQNIAGATEAAANTPEAQTAAWIQSWDMSRLPDALGPNSGLAAVRDAHAQRAQEEQVNATNARFGTDLSWLDPSFQYNPALLAQSAGSQAFADPNSIAAQNAAMQQAQQFANTNLNFQSPAQQQALMGQWAGIQGGQGAPSFMGNAQQQGILAQLQGIAAPRFSGDSDQRAVLNQALGMASNTGPGSLQFDTSGRQGEQYGNLQGIIAGGGATAIEMADRARQRADSEAWLRGQREADMADYAERGLTGSGMELLALSSDRQAAAGRNSLADLETAKALEERRLGAINSAAGLATNMRGQTIDEQGLLNSRATAGLGAASSVANAMRSANIQEQLGTHEALLNQQNSAANIANQMRTGTFNENSYLDQRAINALTQQTGLANTMRGQTAEEQIANRSAQQAALGTLASTASNARGQSAQESQFRAGSADDFAARNQAAINSAAQANTGFLQNSYQQMMNNRQQWEQLMASLGVNVSQGLMNEDQQENVVGFNQGTGIGMANANQANSAANNYRSDLMNMYTGGQAGVNAANQQSNLIYPQLGAWAGDVAGTVGSMGINAASNAGGQGGGGSLPNAPSTNLSAPTGASNPYGVGVGGGATGGNPYGVSVTGNRTGSFLPQNYDYNRLMNG